MQYLYKALSAVIVAAAMALSAAQSGADNNGHSREIEFVIENATHGITFRPFLVAAHPRQHPVFRLGEPATDDSAFAGLQLMAECGALGPAPFANLVERMGSVDAEFIANPVNIAKPFDPPLGLLFPAGTTDGETAVPFDAGLPGKVKGSFVVRNRRNTHLSVVAMLLPTNDAFVGLDSVPIPRRGTRTYYLYAYDAGTEANNELMTDDNPLDCVPGEPGYPVDPLGATGIGGSGGPTSEVADRVHIHPGNVGDADPFGGFSDLDSRVHRWNNPVVKLTISVRKPKHE